MMSDFSEIVGYELYSFVFLPVYLDLSNYTITFS